MGMMSQYDLIHGESVVLNCTASYWSVSVYPGDPHHWLLFCLTLIGQFRSHDLFKLPLQFSTKLSSSGVLFSYEQEYSLILVHDLYSIGYKGPIFHKRWCTFV